MTDSTTTTPPPKSPRKAPARPPAPKAPRTPKPLDAEAIRGALAIMADHGNNNRALVTELLTARGLKLKFSAGTHLASLHGVRASNTSGEAAALDAWANAARRALLGMPQ